MPGISELYREIEEAEADKESLPLQFLKHREEARRKNKNPPKKR